MNTRKKIFLALSIILLFIISCSSKKNTDKDTKTIDMTDQNNDIQENLEVHIHIDSITTNNYTTPKLFFTIKNKGSVPVKLVKKLSVGYENTDNRELYLRITKNDSEENIAKNAVFYSREKTNKNDFEWLQPGHTFSTDFLLKEWYEFPDKPYEIQAVYDPTESLPLDDSLAKNKYYSNKIFIPKD